MVLASLCNDPAEPFPGACRTYSAVAQAQTGSTTVVLHNVKLGRYAVQVTHDENGNFPPGLPKEGFAFGNDMAFPPTFDGAAITVTGDTSARVYLVHMLANGNGRQRAASPHRKA